MKADPIIECLVPDPSQVPDVRLISGLLGKAAKDGYWRIYLNPNLTSYVEFCEKDVVHTEQFDREKRLLGGTAVWVKREANLKRIQETSREAQADFLQGSIRSRSRRCGPSTGTNFLPFPFQYAPPVPFTPSLHFFSICDELAAPSFLSGGDVFCGGGSSTWEAECQ